MNNAARPLFKAIPPLIISHLSKIQSLRDSRRVKPDGSFVTEGDLLIQELLFGCIRTHLPDARIVSEEIENKPGAFPGCVVVVDPIDGTENFTSGLCEWGVSVSCFDQGTHVASLLGVPELNQWLVTGIPLSARHYSRIRALSSSLAKEDIIKATQGYEYRIMGCCVYNMFNVIRGSFHSFENPKGANSWDILAGLNLALEHGLHVTVDQSTYAGEYLPSDRKYRFKIEQR